MSGYLDYSGRDDVLSGVFIHVGLSRSRAESALGAPQMRITMLN